MEKNRLQIELERKQSTAGANLIDLSDTNFHANGMRFPESVLRDLIEDYLRHRNYRPDPRGTPQARRAISEYYRNRAVDLSTEHVIITASTSESYSLLFSSLASAGDNVVLPKPTYPLFEYLVEFSRLEPRYYEMKFDDCFRIDIDSVVRRIDADTKFVVLISPNNPTGRTATADEVDALLEACRKTNTMLISDEVFSEMVYDGENEGTTTGTSRPAARNSSVPVFTLNGISKMFASPDLKLAWIAVTGARTVTADLLDRLETANDTFLSCTSLSQHILPGLFERGANLPRQMTDVLRTNRDQLLASCGVPVSRPPQMGEKAVPLRGEGGLRIVPPTGGIHAVIGVPRSAASPWIDDEDLAVTLLRERELYVHPGYFYGIEERENEIYLVVSFLKKHDLLAEGLSRLASFVSGRHRSPTI